MLDCSKGMPLALKPQPAPEQAEEEYYYEDDGYYDEGNFIFWFRWIP